MMRRVRSDLESSAVAPLEFLSGGLSRDTGKDPLLAL
jgi:hypothetical protein